MSLKLFFVSCLDGSYTDRMEGYKEFVIAETSAERAGLTHPSGDAVWSKRFGWVKAETMEQRERVFRLNDNYQKPEEWELDHNGQYWDEEKKAALAKEYAGIKQYSGPDWCCVLDSLKIREIGLANESVTPGEIIITYFFHE